MSWVPALGRGRERETDGDHLTQRGPRQSHTGGCGETKGSFPEVPVLHRSPAVTGSSGPSCSVTPEHEWLLWGLRGEGMALPQVTSLNAE